MKKCKAEVTTGAKMFIASVTQMEIHCPVQDIFVGSTRLTAMTEHPPSLHKKVEASKAFKFCVYCERGSQACSFPKGCHNKTVHGLGYVLINNVLSHDTWSDD